MTETHPGRVCEGCKRLFFEGAQHVVDGRVCGRIVPIGEMFSRLVEIGHMARLVEKGRLHSVGAEEVK